jgi:hypothetical protein
MSRREYRETITCAEPGCRETQWLVHDTRAEQAEAHKRQREKPFKCSRHEHPERNLRPGNEQTAHVLIASRARSGSPDKLFWLREGEDHGGSGYAYGPGFNAHADDFPEGTRLVVRAQIQVPGDSWLDDLARASISAAEAKFGRPEA